MFLQEFSSFGLLQQIAYFISTINLKPEDIHFHFTFIYAQSNNGLVEKIYLPRLPRTNNEIKSNSISLFLCLTEVCLPRQNSGIIIQPGILNRSFTELYSSYANTYISIRSIWLPIFARFCIGLQKNVQMFIYKIGG